MQTPIHDHHNPDLLKLIPVNSKKIIEVGCSSGALAREFKALYPSCFWKGVEVDENYSQLAKRYCDECVTVDIEDTDNAFWEEAADSDCWIFGDTLEHLRDPWAVLKHIRDNIPKSGAVVACIPNAQHWSIQAKISIGDFRYEANGLLDKTHLRWFTRQTIIELFIQQGFQIDMMFPRIFDEPNRAIFLPVIEEMATKMGFDPKVAVNDALPLQYVIRAFPS